MTSILGCVLSRVRVRMDRLLRVQQPYPGPWSGSRGGVTPGHTGRASNVRTTVVRTPNTVLQAPRRAARGNTFFLLKRCFRHRGSVGGPWSDAGMEALYLDAAIAAMRAVPSRVHTA